jgi:hypothetical protein
VTSPSVQLVTQQGIGASNGTSRRAPFDRWFRYPAGFSAQALPQLFSADRGSGNGVVLDPFCGAATVGTAAVARGHGFFGVEAHPEIAQLGSLKLTSLRRGSELLKLAEHLERVDPSADIAGEADLVRRCFDDDVLRRLVGIRQWVHASEEWAQPYFKWALLGTLRDVANVRVGWPYLRPSLPRRAPYRDPIDRMRTRLQWIVADLGTLPESTRATVVHGDSARSDTWDQGDLPPGSMCITSPPYLNNFDYADATRLEMYFWGRNSSWSQMCADVRSGMLVATTQQSSVEKGRAAMEALKEHPSLHAVVEELATKLESERLGRSRGKEYDRVLPSYVLGLVQVLSQVRSRLRPGSWCGWVIGDSAPYGIYVDTPMLIQLAAQSVGFHGNESVIMRDRGLKWRTNGTRHQVALNERVIWFRAS